MPISRETRYPYVTATYAGGDRLRAIATGIRTEALSIDAIETQGRLMALSGDLERFADDLDRMVGALIERTVAQELLGRP